ncbi:MAG TPA: hemolysin family protein [Acidimicrobiia bacterium]|nr:hemolysin family protein [Acidimicrobiia bacterium]
MNETAFALGVVVAVMAAVLRFAGSSLLHTPRADALRDAADGDRGAAKVAEMLERPPLVLQPSIGAVHSALLVAAAIPLTWAVTTVASGVALGGAFLGLGAFLVAFGDVIPRSLGRRRPGRAAYRTWWLTKPAAAVGRLAADLLVADDGEEVSPENSEEQESEEIELIESVVAFGDAIVREVMVPRSDMITVATTDDTDRALDVVLEYGRSRVPVVGNGVDDVVGILFARDLLTLMDAGTGPRPVTEIMRPPSFVPETKRVSELLREMQAAKNHLCMVVDEFGSIAGLVTFEDLVEEIVGEIVDEYDEEAPMVEALGDGAYAVDARLSVDELSDAIGHPIPTGDWDTVGGLVLALAGRVPEEGEAFEVEGLTLTVDGVQGRRVSRVRISPS